MPPLIYQNSEALRCAAEQNVAECQLGEAANVTDGLDERVHKTYGSSSSKTREDINAAIQARTEAIEAMQQLASRLAELCRSADTAYQNIDQQAAENLDQQLLGMS